MAPRWPQCPRCPQESISDFYWYYSGKDVIDEQGKRNFSKAMAVAKQVFNSLTEYIQGPCTGNQQSLAHSRLWDAVVGFLHVFAHMMKKLAQDSSQLGLLKELLDLQKDMVVMLLSLLEGNVVNGTIARQMVDMLVESSSNVTMILKFFDMFLKLRDIVSSDAFRHFVTDPRGLISKKDFQKAMDSQKQYEPDEIQFLLSCSEADENEMIDVESFAQRFQEPARDIGFNVAVLLTNLSEHVPHDQRLKTFLEQAESILDYFRPFLGRIEIMGAARRIERIYFEISGANKAQWEMPQVKESKRQFIFDVVNEGGEAEKMELFVNFCEDTIFEMQIASRISEEEAPRDEEEDEDEDREEEEPASVEAPAPALPGLGLPLPHPLGSFLCIIGYNCLKIPLVIFKREKEVARRLEFSGLYITEQPPDDDVKGQWDRLVLNAQSFPSNYWDKFIKRKVLEKYGDIYGRERIAELLGMDLASVEIGAQGERRTPPDSSLLTCCAQLVMTVGLLAVVVYLYTVVAFNFFRKFYNKSEDEDEPDMKCDDMMTCYLFHMYVGVRAGGGIGDEIEDPAGDDYELYRVVFDITFFFFVIVILLAIIQGGHPCQWARGAVGGPPCPDPPPQFLLQESYVWKMYQERCWDFFPAGDCFRKQYEDQLG
ncbi:PREDICTED: ryanodine receptor 1 [Corvus brachyrhynchos]|uniref:ryanodine receptor 1 n=1 Tax=Corvus brachyrhynchos TaxID=85066 RepID=UPI0008163AA4|nr:PREDICTED: ryanodine receptor 1 [Corvus brachyrhynchos]